MSIDRDQILRDAEWLAQIQTGVAADRARLLGAELLALLIELEQAERKRDDALDHLRSEERLHRATEARLAKVPELVEAAKELQRVCGLGGLGAAVADASAKHRLDAALAAWEAE